jgi:hypothetical protein
MDSTPPPQTFLFKKWKIELPLLNRWVIMSRDIFSKELENNYIFFFNDLENKLLKKNLWHPCLTPEYQMVSAQALRKNKKKDVIPTYSIFQHVSII